MSDVRIGRWTRTERTHCSKGHLYDEANTTWKLNAKGYRCRECKECGRQRMQRKRENPEFKAMEAAKMRRWRKANPEAYKATYTAEFEKRRQILLNARANGCKTCDEKDPACLDFHHRDPNTKEGHIGEFRKFGMKRLLAEIAKCDVLCANCHRKHHRDARQAVKL